MPMCTGLEATTPNDLCEISAWINSFAYINIECGHSLQAIFPMLIDKTREYRNTTGRTGGAL